MQLRRIVNKYFLHDARRLDSLLPTGIACVDVTITSPPYWNIKDYGHRNQIGFGQSYEQYLQDVDQVFRTIYSATKSTGSLWIIADTFKENGELRLLPFDIASRLQAAGWLLQDIIIWQKDRTLPWSHQGKLRNIFEYIACYSKTRTFNYHLGDIREIGNLKDYWVRYPERYSPEGKAPSRTWSIPIPRQGAWGESGNYVRHACPLPIELVERILRLTTKPGDLVFDPFAGSGTVLASAKAMKRRFLGTDLNATYRRMFYTDVLPRVDARYKERGHIDSIQKAARDRFASAVLDLRCLKLPKELVRLYRSGHGSFPGTTILAIPSQSRRRLTLIVCLPKRARISRGTLENRLATLIEKRPLSKYGVEVELKVVRSASALRLVLRHRSISANRRLSEYIDGKFYSALRTAPLRSHLEADLFESRATNSRDYPLLLSTLCVCISPNDPAPFLEARNGDDEKAPAAY